MKIRIQKIALSLTVASALLLPAIHSQSVDDLIANYSGKAVWDKTESELTFATAGVITFDNKGPSTQHFWNVPKEVKTITIEADVRVIGAFILEPIARFAESIA